MQLGAKNACLLTQHNVIDQPRHFDLRAMRIILLTPMGSLNLPVVQTKLSCTSLNWCRGDEYLKQICSCGF